LTQDDFLELKQMIQKKTYKQDQTLIIEKLLKNLNSEKQMRLESEEQHS